MREKLVVIGNGMVGVRFLERLTEHAADRYDVTAIGAEPAHGYNRVLLSALLAGDVTQADVELRGRDWYAQANITLRTGIAVQSIDRDARRLVLADGSRLTYDKLVLATGSSAIRLPLPGVDLPGVVAFRDVADLEVMRTRASQGTPVAVIGGGLLGIEAAYGLARLGCDVTLIHVMPRLMERQLDDRAGAILRDALLRKGVKVKLSAQTAGIAGDDHVERLDFKDGSALPASLVVMAVGVRPHAALAQTAGLAVGRGIKVDDGLATSDERIFAIGECAEHAGQTYGLVEPGYDQADVLARRLAGDDAAYPGSTLSTSLKVSGVGVFSAGAFEGIEGAASARFEDRGRKHYRRLVFQGDRLAGVILIGDTGDGPWYREMIRAGAPIDPRLRPDLIFGRALALPEREAA